METKMNRDATKDLERGDQLDRLSNLPDEILFLILEGMPTNLAAKTSVLSRRWQHLFKQCSNITMGRDFCPQEYQNSKFTFDDMVESNARLIQAMKSMLQCQRLIRNLCLKFYLMEGSMDIVRCVDKAMNNRRISSLQFEVYPPHEATKYTQDHKLNYGRLFMEFIGVAPRTFGALSHLHIWFVHLSIDNMTNVLNACNNLEHLELYCCDYDYGMLSVMKIEHSRLSTLVLAHCRYLTIELSCLPRLTRLTCNFWVETNEHYPISFGYVPQLSMLVLANPSTIHRQKTVKLSEFLGNNVMIRELDLDFFSLKVWIQPEAPKFLGPVLKNLQSLYLRSIREDCDLDWTMFFLEAAPFLKKIHVQVWDHPIWGGRKDESQDHIQLCERFYQKKSDHLSWQVSDDLKHSCLKELVISGYQAKSKFTRYIRRVLKAAVKLERVTLRQNVSCKESDSCKYCMCPPSTIFPRTKGLIDSVKRQISKWASSPIEIKLE